MAAWSAHTWYKVESENLLEVRYRLDTFKLDVIFRAATNYVYTYRNVSWGEFIAIMDAESKGGAFNRLIRSRPQLHPYKRRKAW